MSRIIFYIHQAMKKRLWSVLFVYLKLQFLRLFGRPPEVRLFGKNISMRKGTYKSFLGLFEQIFIDETYALVDLPKNANVIDCGSNIGLVSLYYLKYFPTANVIAFDADKEFVSFTKNNTDIEVHHLALTDTDEETVLLKKDKHPEKSMLVNEVGEDVMEVPAGRLSNHIKEDIDLLKIDVEGSEGAVIHDLFETKKIDNVKNMIFEYHTDLCKYKLSEILAWLEQSGFVIVVNAREKLPFKRRKQTFMIFAYKQ